MIFKTDLCMYYCLYNVIHCCFVIPLFLHSKILHGQSDISELLNDKPLPVVTVLIFFKIGLSQVDQQWNSMAMFKVRYLPQTLLCEKLSYNNSYFKCEIKCRTHVRVSNLAHVHYLWNIQYFKTFLTVCWVGLYMSEPVRILKLKTYWEN